MTEIQRWAHGAVSYALASGKLKRRPCEACTKVDSPTQAHHDDYLKPLDVRWFCVSCHRTWHGRNVALNMGAPVPRNARGRMMIAAMPNGPATPEAAEPASSPGDPPRAPPAAPSSTPGDRRPAAAAMPRGFVWRGKFRPTR